MGLYFGKIDHDIGLHRLPGNLEFPKREIIRRLDLDRILEIDNRTAHLFSDLGDSSLSSNPMGRSKTRTIADNGHASCLLDHFQDGFDNHRVRYNAPFRA